MTKRHSLVTILCSLLLLFATHTLHAEPLKPWKDRLFAYPKVLEGSWEQGYVVFDYKELRDINKRDENPGVRVKRKYISQRPNRSLVAHSAANGASVPYSQVGVSKNASFILIYVHGAGGDQTQGMDDWRFGGNFNRIKNLAFRNSGQYITVSAGDFSPLVIQEVAGLIEKTSSASPDAPLALACASAGATVCWALASQAIADHIDALVLLGGYPANTFTTSRLANRNVPLLIAHGSRDKVFSIERVEAFYKAVKANRPNYPVRLLRFESGTHGTPIRMIDWRKSLNWMLFGR